MVIDDNPIARRILQHLVAQLGLTVHTAASADEALALAAAAEAPDYLVCLVDWMMPQKNGIEAIRELRQIFAARPGRRVPPMLLVTAHSNHEGLRDVGHEIDGLLTKPVSARHVYVELARCLGVCEADTPMQGRRKTDTAQWSRFRGLEVLVVEDVEVNQEVMLELLAGVGIHARLAENGAAALTAVADNLPDVVLMDCQMPVMDGFTATQKLRENPAWKTLPVIALTANAKADDQARCFAAGMNAHLAKPIRMELLYERLLQCLPDYLPLPLPAIVASSTNVEIVDPADNAAALPEFPGIDVALGMAQVGRLPLLLRVLKRFRDNQGQHFAAQFAEALAAADQGGMLRLAHSLKGVAHTLGATDLGDAAAHLETAVAADSPQQLSLQFALVTTQLQHLSAGLHRIDSLLDGAAPPR